MNDHSSVGTAQELSSQASSAEPLTPSPQYSAARVHTATFDSTIGSGTPDPARQPANVDAGDSHLANLLSGLQRSAASLTLDDAPQKPGIQTVTGTAPAPQHTVVVPPPTESPDWSATHVPIRLAVNTERIPQARSSPGFSTRSVDETSSVSGSLSSAATSPTLVAQSSPGHTRRGSAATADISPYLSHAQSITKTMRYHSMLESVAQESDRATSRMSQRPPLGGPSHVPHLPQPASSAPLRSAPMPDQSVIYSSSPALQPAMARPPAHPLYQAHPQDPFMVRPRTSHAYHPPPFSPASVPRQSMNEHQLRALLPLNGPYSGPVSTAFPPSFGRPVQAPTSPIRAVPPQFPPSHLGKGFC